MARSSSPHPEARIIDTNVLNLMWPPEGLVFTDDGTPGNPCYDQLCIPRAYSRVPITSDLMLDASDAPNAGATQSLRVRVTGVHASTVGQDTRTLLTTAGPWYVEAEDNSNLAQSYVNIISAVPDFPVPPELTVTR